MWRDGRRPCTGSASCITSAARSSRIRRQARCVLIVVLHEGPRLKAALWESVTSAAMPVSIIHVSIKVMQQTQCTMRKLRLRRVMFVLWSGRFTLDELHVVAGFLNVFRGNVELVPLESRRSPPTLTPPA